jgi:hypothetical protein
VQGESGDANWRLKGSQIAYVEKYGNVDYVTALLGFETGWQMLTLLHRDSKSSPQPVCQASVCVGVNAYQLW